VSGAINALLVFVVLFPFVPSVVSGTDTQPTFLLFFVMSIVIATTSPHTSLRMYRVTLEWAVGIMAAVLLVYACLLWANALQPRSTIPTRLFAFVQFGAAAAWGYTRQFHWRPIVLYRAMAVYAAFTVAYFATGGIIEDILIRSRESGSESLFAAGRGARTLSPEPSFFALQVFNIFVLSLIVGMRDVVSRRRYVVFLGLTAFCLAASFSAYGALLLIVVLFSAFPRTVALAGIATLAVPGMLLNLLPNWDNIRAIKVLLALVQTRGNIAELAFLDQSFSSRMGSFAEYVRAFASQPLVGEGFSLYQGGGFVSIISALGITALVFFVVVTARVAFGRHSVATKVVLFAWLALNFISGPIGVPILGALVGLLFRAAPAGDTANSAEGSRSITRATHGSAVLT
jgi:hypothetical protein